jgi:hypothetical protein
MVDTLQEVIAEGRLRVLDELLQNWTRVVKRFVDTWKPDGDVPWWYNERASVSVLAAAVWTAGDIAFEEFSSEKERRRSKFMGKIDFRFSFGRQDFVAEAKQCWPLIGPQARSAQDVIDTEFRHARKDVRRAPENEGTRLAIVFASPSFPPGELKDVDGCLRRWRKVFRETQSEAKAFVWVPNCEWIVAEDDGYIYPGTAIFMKIVAGG